MFKTILVFAALTLGALNAEDKPLPSPAELSEVLQKQLKISRKSSVALNSGGAATGVIISEKGLILTAAHVFSSSGKKKRTLQVTLDDGRNFSAESMGYDIEGDIGLLRITNGKDTKFPFSPLAKTTSKVGDFVFTFAHPSGRLKGRPAQVRLGRINGIIKQDNIPFITLSELNIQPGDSGGPLYNLKGELVGINSSAAALQDINMFAPIDLYHRDKAKYNKSEIWGNKTKGPESRSLYKLNNSPELIQAMSKLLSVRYKAKHTPTINFIQSQQRKAKGGKLAITSLDMFNFLMRDAISVKNGSEVSLGLDDPKLVRQLPKKPKHFHSLNVTNGKQTVSRAIALDNQHVLVKASKIKAHLNALELKTPKATFNLKAVRESQELDLAILKLEKPIKLPLIQLPEHIVSVKAAEALFAPDLLTSPLWNIATDERRIVSKKRSLGPLKDRAIISIHRAPYPVAIRHSLPLYAKHEGTPVFDLKGNFIGVHIARFSRTMGLIIPHEKVEAFYQEYKENGAKEVLAAKPKEVKKKKKKKKTAPVKKKAAAPANK